jgi:hypothetical protein
MKRSSYRSGCRIIAALTLAWFSLSQSSAAVFTVDTTIAPENPAYENTDIVVSNATLTVDGPHTFANLLVGPGGTVTHTFSASGTITTNLLVADEPQILTGTNEVLLANSNILLASLVVKDASGTISYQANTDYFVRASDVDTFINRSETSTIPDGAMVLVSYTISGEVAAGLNVSLTGNLEVNAGGFINANGRGTAGTGAGTSAGSPPSGSGGGHGGYGGLSSSNAVGGNCHGTIQSPGTFGSRGGNGTGGLGAPGGGVIRLNVAGTAQIDGLISANGLNATNSRSGGGSGGSVWITAQSVSGSGAITAHGGNGEPIHGGGGGGGRIAVQSETNVFTGALAAYGGTGWRTGGAGSVFTKLGSDAGLILYDNNNQAGTNSLAANPNTADMTIRAGAGVVPSGFWSTRDVLVASNSALLVTAQNSTMNISARNLAVEATAAVRADGAGFGSVQGQSAGGVFAGGAHGGAGANSLTNGLGGVPHGTQTSPSTLGYGGGGTNLVAGSGGGAGGGAILLTISNELLVQGQISALGKNGTPGGGGAGGTIRISTQTLNGAGALTADGGNGGLPLSGGGGGGRIAITASTNNFTGSISAIGGGGATRGGAGTIYYQLMGTAGPVVQELTVDNGGFPAPNARTNTVISSLNGPTTLIVRNGASALSGFLSTVGRLFVGSGSSLLLSGSETVTVNGSVLVESGGAIHSDGMGNQFNANGSSTIVGQGVYYGGGGGHGGYGGQGGAALARGGISHGTALAPFTSGGAGAGSGSSFSPFGGSGGGVLRLTVNGSITNHGRISSDGKPGSGAYAGGGAGGSVVLTVNQLRGSGSISANGGAGVLPFGGGGGGGRIAITMTSNLFTGAITAYGGSGTNYGGAGTVYIRTNLSNFGHLIVDNGGNFGTNTTMMDTSYNGDITVSGGGVMISSFISGPRYVLIKTNGILVMPVSTSQQSVSLSGNLTIDAGGLFSLDGRGNGPQSGPGAGSNFQNVRGGGGHGGYGGGNTLSGGNAYNSITIPNMAGSGGGGGPTSPPFGGAGGGALRLQLVGNTGVLTVNGRLSANGLSGDANMGGGSGGSLYLTTGTLAGNGIISANGGAGNGNAGGGGGGRIAVTYNSNLFTGQLTASGGNGTVAGGAGTIYTKPNSAPTGTVLIDNGGQFGTNTPLSSSFGLPQAPFNLTITGGASTFALTPLPQLSSLVINAASMLTMRSTDTNVLLNVLSNATIATGGAINVDGKGTGLGLGTAPGASIANKGAGGGHGGAGGNSQSGALGGTNYGSITQPVLRGSGGGAGANTYINGCEGGGAIRLTVGGTLTVAGSLSANGNPGIQDDSGGGAGGGIWLTAGALTGSGNIFAEGGDGDLFGGGGGAGGRIAIYAPTNTFAGLLSVIGGDGATAGGLGTIFITTNLTPVLDISGRITNSVGQGVAGVPVLFQSSVPGQSTSATTDTNGNYLLVIPTFWYGSIIPALATNVFLPGSYYYAAIPTALADQDFLMVETIAPAITLGGSGTNLFLNWNGLPGIVYTVESSTNLVDWMMASGNFYGAGAHQVIVPIDPTPALFFRIRGFY